MIVLDRACDLCYRGATVTTEGDGHGLPTPEPVPVSESHRQSDRLVGSAVQHGLGARTAGPGAFRAHRLPTGRAVSSLFCSLQAIDLVDIL